MEIDLVLAVPDDRFGESAGGDDMAFLTEFFFDLIDHAVDHAHRAPHHARADTLVGILADDG